MFPCNTSAKYNMKADVYVSSLTTNQYTGASQKTWTLLKSIDCSVRGTLRKGVGDNSAIANTVDQMEKYSESLKMRTRQILNTDYRIANVRNRSGAIWKEGDDVGQFGNGVNGTTVFEVTGTVPIVGVDGSVLEYEITLLRQDIQKLPPPTTTPAP
jgi:hypothetical protein